MKNRKPYPNSLNSKLVDWIMTITFFIFFWALVSAIVWRITA